jgi:hypothetical protein
MPLYDIECSECGIIEDVICAYEERNLCPECGVEGKMVPIMPPTVGIVWSNQEHSKQLGRTFETNKQKREWMKKHPRVSEVRKGSTEDRDKRQSMANHADTVVKRFGYKNVRHYQAEAKKKNKKKAAPAA